MQSVGRQKGVRGERVALSQNEEDVTFLSDSHAFDRFELSLILFFRGVLQFVRVHLFHVARERKSFFAARLIGRNPKCGRYKKLMTTDAPEVEAEMLGDFRPGYTLWKKRMPAFDAIIIQGEGGDLISQDVEAGFVIMKRLIRESKRYVTFYDLTDGMKNLWPQAPALLRFAAEMRSDASERQVCTVAVCPEEKVRNWVRWILGVASKGTIYYISRSSADAWKYLESGAVAAESDSFGEGADLPQTLLSQEFASLEDPSSLLREPSFLQLL